MVIQCMPGGSHIGKSGIALRLRHCFGTEHGALGLHGHIGVVLVPVHVSADDFHHVVIRGVTQTAIRPQVAQFYRFQTLDQCPKATCERDLLVVGQELSREDQ